MDYFYLLVYAFYKLPQDQWICSHITGNDLIVKHNTDTSHTDRNPTFVWKQQSVQ